MKAYAILGDTITLYDTVAEARQALAAAPEVLPALVITSEHELATSSLSMGQLVELWNGFAGVVPFDELRPVKKFTDRQTAVARIWRAIQRLAPTREKADAAPQSANVAPKRAKATKEANTPSESSTAREGSKKAIVLDLLRRPQGRYAPSSVRGHRLAAPQRPRVPLGHAGQEDGAQDHPPQARRWRQCVLSHPVGGAP